MNFAKYGLERRFASKATSRRGVRFAMHFQLQATLEAARKLQVLSASKVAAAGAESQSARKNVVEVDFKNRITTPSGLT